MSNEKKRRFFSGFDVVVVSLVVLAVLAWIFVINRTPEVEPTTVGEQGIFRLEVPQLTAEQVARVQVGDNLLEGSQHLPLGEVVEVRTEPHMLRVDNREERTINWVPWPDRYVLIITVSTSVIHTERELLAGEGQVVIRGGAGLHFTGPDYAFTHATILGW
ncbi:MAG: hypothetical protein FWC72_08290, partial [Oscillospiraceae bacterium]|nr:hypothetical protein [Oscillospiraceae bacterium]